MNLSGEYLKYGTSPDSMKGMIEVKKLSHRKTIAFISAVLLTVSRTGLLNANAFDWIYRGVEISGTNPEIFSKVTTPESIPLD